ncbi:hypothetical protein [Burkholderia anthina]
MQNRISLDDVAAGGALARLKLVGELARIKAGLKDAGEGPLAAVKRLKLVARANQIRVALGAASQPKATPPAAGPNPAQVATTPEPPSGDDEPVAPRNQTAQYYEFDPNRKPAQRKKDNAAAMALLKRIDAGEVDAARLSPEEKLALAKYSGTGGALIGADGKKGSAYEYYTPKPIAEGIWDLMAELGFAGGKVLDPCAGVGIFGATAPLNAAIDAVELNETSGRINGLVNAGPGYTATVAPFERVAAATPDEQYDAVVTNVPFGGVADRGGNQLLDGRYQKEPLQNYFILRTLEKLKPGGLAVFITPPRCVSGKGGKEEELRVKASYMAEFLGAYRLPNSVFGTASADTMTDVIAFRKYGREALDKIAELREQSPKALIDANVQWQPFIEGRYFDGEGKRFILGEFVPKDPNKFRDVDRVTTDRPIAEIARMLKKFPGSRVDWDMLGTVETTPITYRDGDTITQAGQTLQMQDGRWVPMARGEDSASMAELVGKLTTPYAAFEGRIQWADAERCVDYMIETSQSLDIPDWLRGAMTEIRHLKDEGDRAQFWNAGIVGMAAAQVLQERLGEETGVNFAEEYPALTDAMQRVATTAKKRPAALGGKLRDGLVLIGNHYQKKTGLSAVWRGDVQQQAPTVEITADASFEGLRYKTKSAWVSLEDAKGIYGDGFDPYADPAWCLSPDGKSVTRADDYYVGNYAEFLRRVDADIASAASDDIRAKLLRQKLDAGARIDKVDVSKLTFNLFSPHVTLEEKAEFLRRFVHPSAAVIYDERTGEKRVDIDVPGSNLTDREKLLNRIGDYLKNGTITLGGVKLGMDDAKALQELRRMVNTANEQFNGWVRGNRPIVARLEAVAADPAKLRFRQVEDEAPMPIPGMNDGLTLHGYQNAYVRKTSREFGGINGFGVGLGKTFTALAATQYAQSIGVKSKTFFVVPNSVLSNWRKEAARAYASTDDCLFVGLRVGKDGKATISATNFDADLTAVMENRHSKVFMTLEAFERIRLRDETIGAYEAFMRQADASFAESMDKKEDERAKSKQAGLLSVLSNKRGGAPYLEDMGVDSIVFDEGHVFKNSAQTVDFKGAKFLSLSPASRRGIDAQAKAWFIRGKSELKDGVMVLTATPITNSPLEIYAMLSLAVGHERVNDVCLGIRGADDFMEMMCAKENQDDVTMDGVARTTDVFVGLNNVGVLRKAIGEVATIKSAEDVGEQIAVPDREEKAAPVALPPDVVERLKLYKSAFRYAIDEISEKSPNRGDPEAYAQVAQHFGEELNLIGHPFNLINKMTLLIADPELDQRATFYSYLPTQADKAKAAIEQFNARKFTEERPRPGPMTDEAAIVGHKTVKDSGGNETELLKIEVRAKAIDGGRVVIDTIDPDVQSAFEAIAEKLGLDLDVSVPPKLAAMLENFQHEQASPRGIDADGQRSPIVKQIVFCDILPLHNKIKRLLTRRAGVPSAAIAIITGRTNNTPDEILAVQDGFNGTGEDNKYQTVIANEKAEVGINLQKGTQAIHHLTIGWTPDSLEQRNGRGVRQGNLTARVSLYYYDADGTFDTSKRAMVNKKADWIGQVMDVNGSDSVAVTGGLSKEQMEALIDVVGDADAMRRMQETIAAKEAASRASSNRDRQMINLDTIRKQNAFLNDNQTAASFVIRKIIGLWGLEKQAEKLRDRISNPKATATAVAKNESLLAELMASVGGLRRQIEQSATLFRTEWRAGGSTSEPATLDSFFAAVRGGKKQKDDDIESMLLGRSYPSFGLNVIEGGPIGNEWQAEVDMARSMIDEAKAAFARQAGESGGYPAGVADAIARGEGIIYNGKPLIHGTFVRVPDGLAVLKLESGRPGAFGRSLDGTPLAANTAAVMAGEWFYQGTAGYDACLTDAAQIEDTINASGTVENGFSSVVPEVAQRRKVEALAAYSTHDYRLPQPHFPFAISPTDADKSEVKRRIFDAQKAIIRSFDDGKFVVPSDTPVTRRASNEDSTARHDALREFATANGLKLTVADLDDFDLWVQKQIEKTVSLDDLKAALTGSTEPEVIEQATAFMRAASPWFDWQEKDPASDYLPYGFKAAIAAAVRQIVAGDDRSAGPSPSDVVGIRGNTKVWKETIKRCANMAGFGKYKWDGDALAWNVYRSTWDYLIANYPQAADQLELTAATRSL